MKTLIIQKDQAYKRLDQVIHSAFPKMPMNTLYKTFRKKDIKVNGVRVKENHLPSENDKVEIYLADDLFLGTGKTIDLDIAYEDENLIIVNKPQGILSYAAEKNNTKTIVDHVRQYLVQNGEAAGVVRACHRLDRNTGGLLMLAKNIEAEDIILEKLKAREIRKFYICIAHNKFAKQSATLTAYLRKSEEENRVYIYDKPQAGAMEIITKYNVLEYKQSMSKLEVELVTGKTHQIRAHLAYIGNPIAGDQKYGHKDQKSAEAPKIKHQALWAYKLIFDFQTPAGILDYLRGKEIQIEPKI